MTWKYVVLNLGLYLFFSFAGGFPADTYLVMSFFLYAMQGAYLEEKNHTFLLFKTLPIKPSAVVLSKYLGTLLVGSAMIAIGVADMLFIRPQSIDKVIIMILGAAVMLVVMGIFIMLFFRYGYSKSSSLSMIMFLVIFVLSMLPNLPLAQFDQLKPLFGFLHQPPHSWSVIVGIMGVMLGGYCLTAMFAVKFYISQENF